MKSWLNQHRLALIAAFSRLFEAPLNSLLSLLAIGIALTLPAAGHLLIGNLQQLSGQAASVQQISVFMQPEAGRKAAGEVESRLQKVLPGQWRFVPREAALKRLQAKEGMAEIIASLPRNPLPDAFVVEVPDAAPERLEQWRQQFSAWPQVAHVQLDSAWVRRFAGFLQLARLSVNLLAAVFGVGLVAITFNTIRLQVLSHSSEIEVARLIGATNAFIRRPFYYFGALQGLAGGLLAAFLVALGFRLLNAPIAELARLYGSDFSLTGPTLVQTLQLSGAGAALGWLGGQLSVSLSLRQIRAA